MEKTMFMLVAVAFSTFTNQVYGLPLAEMKYIYLQGIGKTFETGLNKLVKNNDEKHVPFIQSLKDNGCEFLSNKLQIKSFINITRIQACLELTEAIGEMAGDIEYTYVLGEFYAWITLKGAENVSACLENEDVTVISICLLQAFNNYAASIADLNKSLIYVLQDEEYLEDSIVDRFNGCFEGSEVHYTDIPKLFAKRYCKTETHD